MTSTTKQRLNVDPIGFSSPHKHLVNIDELGTEFV